MELEQVELCGTRFCKPMQTSDSCRSMLLWGSGSWTSCPDASREREAMIPVHKCPSFRRPCASKKHLPELVRISILFESKSTEGLLLKVVKGIKSLALRRLSGTSKGIVGSKQYIDQKNVWSEQLASKFHPIQHKYHAYTVLILSSVSEF